MKSKVKFVVVCVLVIFAGFQTVPAATPAQAPSSNRQVVDTFEKHWSTAKGLALAVANAMPAESYDFKPVAPEMSFGEQMLHIAEANYGFCSYIADSKSPLPEPAKGARIEKADAAKTLGASFDYCTNIFDGLDDSKLSQMHGAGKRSLSTLDIMLGVMIHMSHHRGQSEVYLRLKGITPPQYKW